jgi:hypothetical protein
MKKKKLYFTLYRVAKNMETVKYFQNGSSEFLGIWYKVKGSYILLLVILYPWKLL